jgi:hypothetical protein
MGIPVNEFKERLNKSLGMQMIVAGLGMLVDDEGHSFREALQIERLIEQNVFPALMEMEGDRNASSSKATI